MPGIETDLSLQTTSLYQSTSAGNSDFSLPNFESKSNRSRALSGIRRPTGYSLMTTSQLAPTDSLSLQATSILHSESARDSDDNFTPNDSKVPRKTTKPHRLTAIHGKNTTTFDNFCLQATSVLSDKNDLTLPGVIAGNKVAGRLRKTSCAHKRTTPLVAANDLNLRATSIRCEQSTSRQTTIG